MFLSTQSLTKKKKKKVLPKLWGRGGTYIKELIMSAWLMINIP
jgi:hypothetical protein